MATTGTLPGRDCLTFTVMHRRCAHGYILSVGTRECITTLILYATTVADWRNIMNINYDNPIIDRLAETLIFRAKMSKSFKITSEHIGSEGLQNWKNLCSMMHKATWNYVKFCEDASANGASDVTAKRVRDDLYVIAGGIIKAIGPINGYTLGGHTVFVKIDGEITKSVAHDAIVNSAIACMGSLRDEYHGEALLVKSERDNVASELRELRKTNGVNPDRIKALETRQANLDSRLKDLKAIPGMVTVKHVKPGDETFRRNLEASLTFIVGSQSRRSFDELKLEDERLKAERKARRKANKDKGKQ